MRKRIASFLLVLINMKPKAILSLLLVFIICLTACSQPKSVSDNTVAEVQQAEETPAVHVEEEPQVTDTVTQPEEQQDVQEALAKEEAAPETETNSEDMELPATNDADIERMFIEMVKNYSGDESELTEEEKEYLEMLRDFVEANPEGSIVNNTTPDSQVPSDPGVDEPVIPEQPAKTEVTDAEIKTTLSNFANNFKSTSAFSRVDGVALEYVDKNLDTLRNNPESSKTIKSLMDDYKEGFLSEAEFIYTLELWIIGGGPYGGTKISVQ